MTARGLGQGELTVELGTGFADADVTVLVDGAEVWHQRGVTTNYSIGLADIVRIPLAVAHASTVEVRVSGDGRRTRSVTSRASDASQLRCDLDPAGNMSIGPPPGGPVF